METCKLMTGQTTTFYASSGTGVILREGNVCVTVNNMQMDCYGWKEEMGLDGSGEWIAPRSGWYSIHARQPALLYVTKPSSLVLRFWTTLSAISRRMLGVTSSIKPGSYSR
ncbi:hypothetical protein QN379_18995 [Glaciimonas sp. Gout2]|uniref:hypothetical protein n=2 Tax=Glaciimonas TaxID=1229970 RepID=UPI002B226E4A|nr:MULTISPECIES: hypothetical protein [unclassified Glaciimonas]MEB0014005.1 hypothetical protein [Glaciimonas sp. Cout2]MEB0084099.1 hypothetical protein [Glaciimonas sp. Gout2]